jgi:hypothetical protein
MTTMNARAMRVARAAQQQWERIIQMMPELRTAYIRYLSDPKTIDWHRTIENIARSSSEPLKGSFLTLANN